MYAVVEINGKQYRAEKGSTFSVDRFDAEKGSSVSFDKVLLLGGEAVKVGAPYVSGAAVKVTVQDEVKGDKVIIFKHKAKKDYRLTQGHRQRYTVVKVEDIVG
ncbi:MAG TPA: 50S ribosomal protein L21 [Rectinemataceae bacterium]|nr:50S ribosomal protein L21 [Rectinemataceae bacterium]